MPDLPDAAEWCKILACFPPGPNLSCFKMPIEEGGPQVLCNLKGQLQDDVWMYHFDGAKGNDPRFVSPCGVLPGRFAVRPIPSPLVLNCEFSMVDCRRFEAVCFSLAGEELIRIQDAAYPNLTMQHLAQIVKDAALEQSMLKSRNQQVHVLMNGATRILANDTLLFDWLEGAGPPKYIVQAEAPVNRKRKAQ